MLIRLFAPLLASRLGSHLLIRVMMRAFRRARG